MALAASAIDTLWKAVFGDQQRPELYTSKIPDEDGFLPLNDAQLFTPEPGDHTADQIYAISSNNQLAMKRAQDEYFEIQDAINELQGKDPARNPQDLPSRVTFEAIKESQIYGYKFDKSRPALLNVDGDRIRKETVSEQEKADVQLFQEPFEQGGFVPTDRQYKQILAKAKDSLNPDGWKPVEKAGKRLIPRKQQHHDEYTYTRPERFLNTIGTEDARPGTAGSLESSMTPSKPPTNKRVFRTRYGGQKIPPTREVSEAPSSTSTPRRRDTPKLMHVPIVHAPPTSVPDGSPVPKRRRVNGYDSPQIKARAETPNGPTNWNAPAQYPFPPPPPQPQTNSYYHDYPHAMTQHHQVPPYQHSLQGPPFNTTHSISQHPPVSTVQSQSQHHLPQNQLHLPHQQPPAPSQRPSTTHLPPASSTLNSKSTFPPLPNSPLYPSYLASMRSRKWTNDDLLSSLAIDHSWLDPNNPKEAARKRAGLEKSQNPVRSLSMYLKWQFWDREGMNKRPRRADSERGGKGTPTPTLTPAPPSLVQNGLNAQAEIGTENNVTTYGNGNTTGQQRTGDTTHQELQVNGMVNGASELDTITLPKQRPRSTKPKPKPPELLDLFVVNGEIDLNKYELSSPEEDHTRTTDPSQPTHVRPEKTRSSPPSSSAANATITGSTVTEAANTGITIPPSDAKQVNGHTLTSPTADDGGGGDTHKNRPAWSYEHPVLYWSIMAREEDQDERKAKPEEHKQAPVN